MELTQKELRDDITNGQTDATVALLRWQNQLINHSVSQSFYTVQNVSRPSKSLNARQADN